MTMLVLAVVMFGGVLGADLVIRIPGDLSQQDGYYRLNYRYVGHSGTQWDTVGHSGTQWDTWN